MPHPSDIMQLQIMTLDYTLEPVLFEFGPGGGTHFKKVQHPERLNIVSNMEFWATREFMEALSDAVAGQLNGPYKMQNNPASMARLNSIIQSVIADGQGCATISTVQFDNLEFKVDAAPEYFKQ